MKSEWDTGVELVKGWLDALSVGALVAWAIGWMPAAATVLTFVWSAVRLWETKTVQAMVKRWTS